MAGREFSGYDASTGAVFYNAHMILIDPPEEPFSATVRVRHTKWEEPRCTVFPEEDGLVRILCETPVRAPAPGQSAVLYDGERVLGGGFIV